MHNFIIRVETEQDFALVENLNREAFWNVYKPGCDEHYYAHCLRKHPDFIPELSFVLERNGQIIGSIMYFKTKLVSHEGREKQILSFGPLCVLPEFQRRGYGKQLIDHSCAKAREMGWDTVAIFGNPANYVGRGFVSCKRLGVDMEGFYPTALLVKELIPGTLAGQKWHFVDCDAAECCADLDAVAAFDAQFLPKEKAWMPTQEEFYIYSHSCVVR